MKLQASPLFLNRIFASALLVLLCGSAALSQTNKPSKKELPRGHYFVSCRPYTGEGYKSLPALVTGVTSNTEEGIQVEKVEVTNNSNRTIERLKFSWYLSTQENPGTILLQGQTKLLGIPDGIKAGEQVEILYPVTSFADAVKGWGTQGIALDGMYVLQIAISEVKFAGRSTQVLLALRNGQPQRGTFSKAAYRVKPRPQEGFCPNQSCAVETVEGQPVGYTCAGATGQSCSNSANGQSCSSSICHVGGGGPPKPPIRPIEP